MNREWLAWAGGFFVGEGSFILNRHVTSQHVRARITISQIEPEPLHRFRGCVLGLGVIRGPYQQRGKKHPTWQYDVSDFQQVQAVVAMLWPFLLGKKRDQATAMMEGAVSYMRARMEENKTCGNGHSRAAFTAVDGGGRKYCTVCRLAQSEKGAERRKMRREAEYEMLGRLFNGEQP